MIQIQQKPLLARLNHDLGLKKLVIQSLADQDLHFSCKEAKEWPDVLYMYEVGGGKKKVASHSGNRTRAAWVKTRNPNH